MTPYERMLASRAARPTKADFKLSLERVPMCCPACQVGTDPDAAIMFLDEELPHVVTRMKPFASNRPPGHYFKCGRCDVIVPFKSVAEAYFVGRLHEADFN